MDIFIARQPIFNTKKQVIAYEILYRNGKKNEYDTNQDEDMATTTVITDTLTNFGLENLTGGKKAFINFTRNLIKEDMPTLFTPEELAIELLENIIVDDELIENASNSKRLAIHLRLTILLVENNLIRLCLILILLKWIFWYLNQKEENT